MDGNHDEAFLSALRENPLDVTTRLVYADWLEEANRGDEAEKHRWIATRKPERFVCLDAPCKYCVAQLPPIVAKSFRWRKYGDVSHECMIDIDLHEFQGGVPLGRHFSSAQSAIRSLQTTALWFVLGRKLLKKFLDNRCPTQFNGMFAWEMNTNFKKPNLLRQRYRIPNEPRQWDKLLMREFDTYEKAMAALEIVANEAFMAGWVPPEV